MKKLLLIAVAGISLATSCFAVLGPSFKFVPITQKGLVLHLTNKADLTLSGQKIEFLNDAKQTVADIDKDGAISIVEEDSNLSLMVNGSPMPVPAPPKVTVTLDKLGKLIAFSTSASGLPGQDDGSQARLFNLTVLVLPDNADHEGSTWTVKIPGDKKLGTVDVTAKYTAEKEESVGTFKAIKVNFEITETSGTTPASSSGSIWIDTKDGMTDKVAATLKNVTLQGSLVDGTISTERKS